MGRATIASATPDLWVSDQAPKVGSCSLRNLSLPAKTRLKVVP